MLNALRFAAIFLYIFVFLALASAQIPITDFQPITENFDSMSTGSALPPNWLVSAPGVIPDWNTPSNSNLVSYSRTSTEVIPTSVLSVNWTCLNCGSDRSPGFKPNSTQPGTNAFIAHYQNLTGSVLRFARLTYTIKQYFISNQLVEVSVSSSKDGTTWSDAGTKLTINQGDLPTAVSGSYLDTPNSATAPFNYYIPWFDLKTDDIPNNGDFYVRWTFTQSTSDASQGVGLDDVVLRAYRSDPVCRSITTPNTSISENFDSLGFSAYNDAVPLGFGYSGRLAKATSTYIPNTGASSSGGLYSFGSNNDSDRAFGTIRADDYDGQIGACFTNNTGRPITSLKIKYDGERWRTRVANRVDKLQFEYSTDATDLTSGTWTADTDLDFTPPLPSSAGVKNGNSPADRVAGITDTLDSLNIPNGTSFYFRWIDFDATGVGDDALAIDNFELTAFVPTAAGVSVSGRVADAGGTPIRGTVLTISGGSLSVPRTLKTGTFGQYVFEGLPAGETYFLSVRAPKYSFAEPTRVVNLPDSVSDLDFIAIPNEARARR